MKTFASTYDFIDFSEPIKDWLKCYGGLNNKLFWNDYLLLLKFCNKKFASSILTLLRQYKIVSAYPKFVPVISVVCKSFILSKHVCEFDPPCYVTTGFSTVKDVKHSSWCYNITSVTSVRVCNFFVSCQSVCEIESIPVDVIHVVHATSVTSYVGKMKRGFR